MKPRRGFLVFLIIFQLEAVIGIENVEGVSGLNAELPCYLTSPDPQDRAILALWYKQGRRLPVYSYDARGTEDRHQTDQEALEHRATFITSASPARLVLKPVTEKDSGIYTCRVDYLTSPTHNTVVNLTVIEPPEKITIYDHQGHVIVNKTNPINEGSPLHLSCVVSGGHPPPIVKWWTDNHSEFSSTQIAKVGKIQTDLTIAEVTRSYHNQVCTCEAKNNNQQPPLAVKIIIDMNLRPLSTTIKVPSDPLIAGVQYSIPCESKGSKPPSDIKWFLEGDQIDSGQTQTRASSGEVTSGVVSFTPKEKDHNKSLKCLASNPAIDGSDISSIIKLNVHYQPIVSLKLGPSLNPKEIKQGGDVYFECQVKANPKPYKVSWFKDGHEIHQNVSRGILVTEKSLVLQKVHRKSAGEFTCQASNTQGSRTSNPVRLDIMFSPECLMDQPAVLAVGRGETVNISCRVASNPLKAMFHWQLNGSERSYSSPGKSTPTGHLISKYTFVGTLDKDYGSLLCWANNSVGTQEEACIFNIIPAGPPSSPENCEILNHTAENIDVSCDKGFDGGLSQAFLAEVYDEGGSLHLNITADEPLFSVDNLRPGTTYVIKVSAFNAKGRSTLVPLTAYTLKVAEKRMGETESLLSSPLILIFLGILGGFILIIVVLVIVTRWRKNISNSSVTVRRVSSPTQPKEPIPVTATTTATKVSPTKTTNPSSYLETKDRNPLIGNTTTPDVEPVIEKAKTKPKKQVMVVENGKIERPGISSASPTETPTIRESFLGRQRDDCFLPNGSAGFYNSLGKTSLGSSSSGHYKNHPSTSPYTSPTYSSSSSAYPPSYGAPSVLPPHHHPHSSLQIPYTRTLPAQPTGHPRVISGLSPLQDDYTPQSYHYNYSTLPRKRGSHGEYLREGDRDRCVNRPSASVEDRYHLMHEWKGNPKYLIRTRDRENDDESFV